MLNLSPLEKNRQAAERGTQEEKQTIEQQQVIQRVPDLVKGKRLPSIQDKVSDNKISIKKPRKVLLRIESKANMQSQEHERERSI